MLERDSVMSFKMNSLESDFVDLELGLEDARRHHTTSEDVLKETSRNTLSVEPSFWIV